LKKEKKEKKRVRRKKNHPTSSVPKLQCLFQCPTPFLDRNIGAPRGEKKGKGTGGREEPFTDSFHAEEEQRHEKKGGEGGEKEGKSGGMLDEV